ncbi:helix-turn-helix domain-containing protein [Cohnella sp. GbtcB17]|uniref:response regulator transcription factor n=1 Tax=Cohnella sp. GbtcB17 TaxID=2824762 RepID=UPI001C30CF37|nr:helix-turn-helix domain-containing protein [Cohnella sp. GbtcB17]
MKLLIADDDRQIREGIKEGIDWASLGIEEVLTASSGTEAFELFSAALPELVVMEDDMPGMDGLELLRRIKDARPATKVIILSGYNDFKYLKKAIQWDAADYEMKPIRARSLIRLIKKVSEEIVRERVSEETFRKYLASHKELFVEDLANGRIGDRLILLDGLMQYYRFDAKGTLLLVRIERDRSGAEAEAAEARSSNEAMLLSAGEGRESEAGELWLETKDGALIGLIKLETASYLYARHAAVSLKNRLTDRIREAYAAGGCSWSAGISGPGSAAEFNGLLMQAKEALDRRLYAGKGAVHAFGDADRLRDDTIRGVADDEDFKALIREAGAARLAERIDAEFARLREEKAYSEKSVAAYCKTLIRLLVLVRESSAELAEFVRVRSEQLDSLPFNELGEYADFVRTAYDEVFGPYGHAGAARLSALMQLADAFIRQHYTQELTVERVAEYVGKTPNYFSHLFKKEMGVPFREYVNRLRIAKAKELIERTTDRIYEIGERVGFSDYAYFTQVFRKLEGCPPTAFRKNRL